MSCRYHATRYNEVSRQRLDIALLTFFQGFRKVYIGEQVMHASKVWPYDQLRKESPLHECSIDKQHELLPLLLLHRLSFPSIACFVVCSPGLGCCPPCSCQKQ